MVDTVKIELSLPVRGYLAKQAIESAVETLARVDFWYLYQNPDTPTLNKSGVIYRREPLGQTERWLSIPELLEQREGDCEDFAAWRIAELRLRSFRALPHVVPIASKPGKWHVMVKVRLPAGRWAVEDPAKEMGM